MWKESSQSVATQTDNLKLGKQKKSSTFVCLRKEIDRSKHKRKENCYNEDLTHKLLSANTTCNMEIVICGFNEGSANINLVTFFC